MLIKCTYICFYKEQLAGLGIERMKLLYLISKLSARYHAYVINKGVIYL